MGELLTVQEVARILRVDDTTVRRWIKNCYQPHVSAGYLGIVLCNHSQHEIAEEIVQEMTEKSTLLGEDINEQSTARGTSEQRGAFSNCEDG